MPIDFSSAVYLPNYNVFARPATFYPLKSQPDIESYGGRGIYATQPFDVAAEDGSVFSDQRSIFDVLDREFTVVPIQGDQLFIPAVGNIPELGRYEVIDVDVNGGGESTLLIRRVIESKPK